MRAYELSGNTLHWRFLYSGVHVLENAKVAFLGINPGGDTAGDHSDYAPPEGSAYTDEAWAGYHVGQSPLQIQVQKLFERLQVAPKDVLAGNLIPFRSPSLARLKRRKACIEFGIELWREVLGTAKPDLVVAMGTSYTAQFERAAEVKVTQRVSVNWGNVSAFAGQSSTRRLVVLPHLSRFRIFGRPESEEAISFLFP